MARDRADRDPSRPDRAEAGADAISAAARSGARTELPGLESCRTRLDRRFTAQLQPGAVIGLACDWARADQCRPRSGGMTHFCAQRYSRNQKHAGRAGSPLLR